MKFIKNKVLETAIMNLYNSLKDEPYGQQFSWKDIAQRTKLKDKLTQDNLYYIANKVCLLLMSSDNRYLETKQGYGKRIIKPEEHNYVAKKKVKSSVKIYHKAGQILASTNMDELTEEQKKQIIYDANKYSTLEMFAKEILQKKKIGVSQKEDLSKASLFLDTIKLFTK
jgi:hypothetical protein